MNRIRVACTVSIYEMDGTNTGFNRPSMTVSSHWSRKELVVLCFDGLKPITVLAEDLKMAVENASNA